MLSTHLIAKNLPAAVVAAGCSARREPFAIDPRSRR
jgi:hypothetical protein